MKTIFNIRLIGKILLLPMCSLLMGGVVFSQQITPIAFDQLEAHMEHRAASDSIYVYNFWATWCKPCVAELPHFEQLHREYADRKVRVVFVSLDFPNYQAALSSFIEKKGLTAETLWLVDPDANAWIPKIDPAWSGVIPATLVLGPRQGIRAFKESSFTHEELTLWINSLIESP